MSKLAQVVIGSLLLAVFFALGYRSHGDTMQKDCTRLNQTVINGQHILCKPYNPKPRNTL